MTGGKSMFENTSLLRETLSLLLDFVPVVGSGKSVIECVSGKDYITGQHVNRWIAAGGIILGIVPFGKLLTKGEKTAQLSEKIASRIVYNADSKKELTQRLERIIPHKAEDLEESLIIQEIRNLDKTKLKDRYGIDAVKSDLQRGHTSDPNLIDQIHVQLMHGGHAVHKHWFASKKKLLEHLSVKQQKKVRSALDDSDEVYEYLMIVLKDSKTYRTKLDRDMIGFANHEKKVLIIHNPNKNQQGTFYYDETPLKKLEKILEKEKGR